MRTLTISRRNVEALIKPLRAEYEQHGYYYVEDEIDAMCSTIERGRYFLVLEEDGICLGNACNSVIGLHDLEHLLYGLGYSPFEERLIGRRRREAGRKLEDLYGEVPYEMHIPLQRDDPRDPALPNSTTNQFGYCLNTDTWHVLRYREPINPEYDFQ